MEDLRHLPAPSTAAQWVARWRDVALANHSKLHGRIWRLLGRDAAPAVVDGLVLEVFTEYQAWEHKFGSLHGRVPEDPWGPLSVRAGRRVLDWRRRYARHDSADAEDVETLLVTETPGGYEQAWIHQRFQDFAQTHPQCAEVLGDYYVEEWTLEEVGKRFCQEAGEDPANYNALANRAKRLIARARQRFAKFVLQTRG